jgi:hypothetical protein
MAEPTEGEIMHMKVLEHMRRQLVQREDMQSVTVKTINEIAKEAAA